MVTVKDIEQVLEDYLMTPDIPFRELRPYLLSEFKWDVDPLKKSQFMIRGIGIKDDMIVDELLKTYLPMETIVLKEL
ncbi:MAG: hypothetical protein ACTSPS_02145 [Promethearchaeota archaeon]